jgi:hypothetical protein
MDEDERADQLVKRIEKLGGTIVWEPDLVAVVLEGDHITDDDLEIFDELPIVESSRWPKPR